MSRATLDAEYSQLELDLVNYFKTGGRIGVIKAPPGSGKTHLLLAVLAARVAAGARVAVAAQTNSQVDDICRRLAKHHSSIPTTRFGSRSSARPEDVPATVAWVTSTAALPSASGVTVATTAKWALTDVDQPYDLLAVDEAWQMGWADLMQCALVSEGYLLIGDPGQIPPVVAIDVRRWETSPRAPHQAAPEVVLGDPDLRRTAYIGSLPSCRRLPAEAVPFVSPFYDFEFEAYASPGTRGLDLPSGHPLGLLADGTPVAVMVATPDDGPPVEVDPDVATAVVAVALDLVGVGAIVRDGGVAPRAIRPTDIGVCSTHRVMNFAVQQTLPATLAGVRVDTPERWQGLERPVMIAIHPLSGVTQPSAFDLETGRLCVMASRHQAGLIVVTRDHVGDTLRNFIPAAEQAPGRPDTVGRGHDAHLRFWSQLVADTRIVPSHSAG